MNRITNATAGVLLAATLALPAMAGVRLTEKDGKWVELGARLQLQYHLIDPTNGDTTDELFFRRLRPYIAGSITENWEGKFEFDIGDAEGSNELAVKDAWMKYTGFDSGNLELTLGNQKPGFSREFLISSKKQELVERTFVGDHNYGTPDHSLVAKLDGANETGKFAWSLAFGGSAHDPDARKLDFDSPANRDADFNDGWLSAARVEFSPQGPIKPDQGFFGGTSGFTLALAAFNWSGDDDNNTYTDTATGRSTTSSKTDLDSSTGFEISVGYRGRGFSVDAEAQAIDADSVDPTFSGGIYRNGTSELTKLALEGGYMVIPARLELVLGHESLDADTYAAAWTRNSIGLNYFWAKQDVKVQFTYRLGEDLNGVPGEDADEAFLQFQFVF